jgi:hypothetical protein
MKQYIWNLLISLDQLCNTILGGFPDETMSSRMGKHIARKEDTCHICRFICKFLSLFEDDHCKKSIEYDEGEKM